MYVLQFLDSYFFGLEYFFVNLSRDVVLDVVPVRDDQVSGPTSSRIQSVSDENSWKHLLYQNDEDNVMSSLEIGYKLMFCLRWYTWMINRNVQSSFTR